MTNHDAITELAVALAQAIDDLRNSAECHYGYRDENGKDWTNCDLYEQVLRRHISFYDAKVLYCEWCSITYNEFWNMGSPRCSINKTGEHGFRTNDPHDLLSASIRIDGIEPR